MEDARQAAITEHKLGRQYLDIAGVMMVVLDPEGRITLLNRTGCGILECTESEALGANWFENFIPSQDRDETRQAFLSLIHQDTEFPEYYENPVMTKAGRERLIAWHNTIIRDESGNIIATLSSGLDITERKRVEQALAESEQRLRNIIELSPMGILTYELQPDGRLILTSSNDAAVSILKIDIYEMVGKTIEEMFPRLVETGLPERYREICTKGGTYHGDDFEYSDANISGFYEFEAFQTSSGKMAVIFMDVTERIRTQRQLQFNQFAMDHAGEAAFWMGPDAKFVYVNEAACLALEYTKEELLNMSVQDIDPDFPADIWPQHWQEVKANKSMRFESHHKTRGGYVFPVEITANFLEYEGREYLCAFARDISERKLAEEAQQKLLREVQSKNEELESIIFIASHDLRSPLVNIRGFTSELEKSLTQIQSLLVGESLSDEVRKQLKLLFDMDIPESLSFINAGNQKMDILLTGLLRLSRIGTAQVCPIKLDMDQMFEGIVNNFRFRIRREDVEITVEKAMPFCRGDVVLINQVFTNLIDNAIKYRHPDRPIKIHVNAEVKEQGVVYCVKDNGIGIATEHISKVFEIFHRLSPGDRGIRPDDCLANP